LAVIKYTSGPNEPVANVNTAQGQKLPPWVLASRRIQTIKRLSTIKMSANICFVESGRAQPSRALLLAWVQELNAPLGLRNATLQQAGFPSVYSTAELHEAVLEPARLAMGQLLRSHDPMPAIRC